MSGMFYIKNAYPKNGVWFKGLGTLKQEGGTLITGTVSIIREVNNCHEVSARKTLHWDRQVQPWEISGICSSEGLGFRV